MNKPVPFILNKLNPPSSENKKSGEEMDLSKSSPNISNISNINQLIDFDSKIKNGQLLVSTENEKEEENISSSLEGESEYHSGRWTDEEHIKFIKGILEYGNEWKMVQKIIKSRTSTQARSHAQKFFLKLKNLLKNKKISENPENLLNYIFNSNQQVDEILNLNNERRHKLLNIILSNLSKDDTQYFKNIQKLNENYSNLENEEEKNYKNSFDKVDSNLKKNIIIISTQNNSSEEEKIFCNKKRESCRKIFEIKKTIKNKYLINDSFNNKINFNKINTEKSNIKFNIRKKIFNLKKINSIKLNHPNIEEKDINNYMDNFNNINNSDSTNIISGIINDKEKPINNISNSLNEFGENSLKNNYYTLNDFCPKNYFFENQKLFFDAVGFNEKIKNYFCYDEKLFRDNYLFKEQDDEISMINKEYN